MGIAPSWEPEILRATGRSEAGVPGSGRSHCLPLNTPVAHHARAPIFARLYRGRGKYGWGWVVVSGVQRDVQEALDTDLDAYLDRELFLQPASEVKPAPVAESPAERLQGVLALAAEEEQWLRAGPTPEQPAENSKDLEGGACEIPEHLRVEPAPEVSPAQPVEPDPASWTPPPGPLPGLALTPHLAQPGWNLPVAPAPVAPSRTPWLVIGALSGVSAASVLVAAMLWVTRDALPTKAQEASADAPAGTVTAVAPPPFTPAPEAVLSVKDSPLARQSGPLLADWGMAAGGAVEALPGPVAPGRMSSRREPSAPAPVPTPVLKTEPAPGAIAQAAAGPGPKPAPEAGAIAHSASAPVIATAKAEPLQPREKVQARRATAVEQQKRRDVEDPTLESTEEEEIPFMQESAVARAPAAGAMAAPAPAAPRKPSEYAELDEDFARELGFTDDAVRKVPESKGVKSVWIPPDPAGELPETLTPEDIQQVVVANQPAVASCIRRHKEAIPGLSGGKFVVRWFVQPSGSTQQIAMETQALKGTALGACIEELVRGWKFPKHRTQMGPIRFPFIF